MASKINKRPTRSQTNWEGRGEQVEGEKKGKKKRGLLDASMRMTGEAKKEGLVALPGFRTLLGKKREEKQTLHGQGDSSFLWLA